MRFTNLTEMSIKRNIISVAEKKRPSGIISSRSLFSDVSTK